MRSGRAMTLVLLCLPMQAEPDPFRAAVEHYRAERYDQAFRDFGALVAAAGDAATPQLLGNFALAALRQRRPADAEAAASVLVQDADVGERALGEFLLAQAAFERALLAELAAKLPDAEPGIWQSAVDAAERARARWLAAANARGRWPEAVRNAERASRKLDELRAGRDAAEQQSKTEKAPEPERPPPDAGSEELPPDLQVPPLSAAEVARLRQRLREKELEKRSLRRTTNRTLRLGEQDW